MSGVIIACIAFGLPVVFAIVLIRAASHYKRDQGQDNGFLVNQSTLSPLQPTAASTSTTVDTSCCR